MLADGALELIAPRRQIGKRAGEFAERLFDRTQRALGFADPPRDLRLALGHTAAVLREPGFFTGKPLQRGIGVGLLALLARDVLHQLREPPIELDNALVDARFLAVER